MVSETHSLSNHFGTGAVEALKSFGNNLVNRATNSIRTTFLPTLNNVSDRVSRLERGSEEEAILHGAPLTLSRVIESHVDDNGQTSYIISEHACDDKGYLTEEALKIILKHGIRTDNRGNKVIPALEDYVLSKRVVSLRTAQSDNLPEKLLLPILKALASSDSIPEVRNALQEIKCGPQRFKLPIDVDASVIRGELTRRLLSSWFVNKKDIQDSVPDEKSLLRVINNLSVLPLN